MKAIVLSISVRSWTVLVKVSESCYVQLEANSLCEVELRHNKSGPQFGHDCAVASAFDGPFLIILSVICYRGLLMRREASLHDTWKIDDAHSCRSFIEHGNPRLHM